MRISDWSSDVCSSDLPSFIDDDFLLNKFSRYLVLGILAMALSLSWGYASILNPGQAMSFGLGSYCMAMALKLRTVPVHTGSERSEEHTSELQSLMRISYAVFCLKKKTETNIQST